MRIIDTHTHVHSKEFDADRAEVLKRAIESGMWLVNIGTDFEDSRAAIELAEKSEEGVYATVGIHPTSLVDEKTFIAEELRKLAQSSPQVVAIGETGLDFYRTSEEDLPAVKKIQEDAFRKSIRIANELNLALVVHARGSQKDPYGVYDLIHSILVEEKAGRGVIHCYGGNVEQAKKFVELGFNLGITGIVTFKNAEMLRQVVTSVPLENLVMETDAPFLAPEPHRGQRNEPSYLIEVAKKIAELKNISVEDVAAETTVNARRMYII